MKTSVLHAVKYKIISLLHKVYEIFTLRNSFDQQIILKWNFIYKKKNDKHSIFFFFFVNHLLKLGG